MQSTYVAIGDVQDTNGMQGAIELRTNASQTWWHIDNFGGELRFVHNNAQGDKVPAYLGSAGLYGAVFN